MKNLNPDLELGDVIKVLDIGECPVVLDPRRLQSTLTENHFYLHHSATPPKLYTDYQVVGQDLCGDMVIYNLQEQGDEGRARTITTRLFPFNIYMKVN